MIQLLFPLLQAALVSGQAPVDDYDVLQYVDPLIGSANGGIYPDIVRVRLTSQEMSLPARRSRTAWPKL